MDIFHTANYTFNSFAIPVVITAVAVLSLGFFVFGKNPDSRVNRSFLAFTTPVFIWLVGYAFSYHANNPETSLTWARGAYLGVVFISPGCFYFVTVLTHVERQWQRFTRISCLVSGFFLPLAFFHPSFISGTQLHSWGYYPLYGPAGALFLIVFFTPMLMMFYVLREAIGKETYTLRQRREFRLVFLAVLIAYTGTVDYLPKFGYDFYPVGYISIFLFVVITSYAIIRNALFVVTPAIAAPAIMTAMLDPLLVTDAEGRVVIANNAAMVTLGGHGADILGKPLGDFLPKAHFLFEKSRMVAPSEGTLVSDYETTLLTNEGKEVPVSISAGMIRDSDKNCAGITVICHHLGKIKAQVLMIEQQRELLLKEVSDRKRAEEALRVLNETLEQRVAEQTGKANARAEELIKSNAELERFSFAASHDLREPLRTVISFLQLLEIRYKGKLDSDADDFIRHAKQGAEWMQMLVEDLLAYSRVGGVRNPLEPTNTMETLKLALANLDLEICNHAVKMTHDPLPIVTADKTQLVVLFQNLIENAIKFRREVPPCIHLSAKRVSDPPQWLFSLSDNGIGIEPQYTEKIFIAFERLHTMEAIPGTGIGLATCRRIMECHGGRIWVESVFGKGSTFYFTFPAREDSPVLSL